MRADAIASLIVGTIKSSLVPVRAAMAQLEAQLGPRVQLLEAQALELVALRERVAILETRAPVPGPAGDPGRDGLDGRDGADGIRLDDLQATYDGDRTLTLTLGAGAVTKSIPLTLPIPRYQGVYTDGRGYAVGDLVTWEGSTWHCQRPTSSRPGDRAEAWRLMVKRGRDYTGRRPAPAGV